MFRMYLGLQVRSGCRNEFDMLHRADLISEGAEALWQDCCLDKAEVLYKSTVFHNTNGSGFWIYAEKNSCNEHGHLKKFVPLICCYYSKLKHGRGKTG